VPIHLGTSSLALLGIALVTGVSSGLAFEFCASLAPLLSRCRPWLHSWIERLQAVANQLEGVRCALPTCPCLTSENEAQILRSAAQAQETGGLLLFL